MKWSFAGVWLVTLGLVGFAILMLFQNITTKNEEDYYLLKEVTEAAMIDSVDVAYYRDTGNVKIVKQKFIENFIRRFAEVASYNSYGYDLELYDIMEVPPKVSVIVRTQSSTINVSGDAEEFDIVNRLDAILETRY